jgi:hypothetical protein
MPRLVAASISIDRVSGANLGAGFADSARFGDRLVRRAAIQSRSEDACHGRLPDAAVAAENVSVGSTALFESILQSAGDVLLSDDLGEFLRPVFARQDGIAHEMEKRLYVMTTWKSRRASA